MSIVIMFTSLVLLILIRVPISLSMLLSSFFYIVLEGRFAFTVMANQVTSALDSFPFLAIPFFVLAAEIMNHSKITDRIFEFATHLVGHVQGGMGQVNILASIIFSGMSGSATADAAGLGAIELRAMIKEKYDPAFAAAITAASSTIGPIIPPSILMVIYGVTSQVSVGRLFAAGIIPGLLLGILLMIITSIMARSGLVKSEKRERSKLKVILKQFVRAVPSLLLPVILLGGIFMGRFTATEAGAVAVLYSLILAFVYGDITLSELPKLFTKGTIAAANVTFLIACASIFGWIVIRARIGHIVYAWISGFGLADWHLIVLINILLIIAGLFIEGVAIIMISVPVFLPVMPALGIHPITLGVLLVLLVMIGFLTPPVGVGVYIVTKLAGARLEKVLMFMLPYMIAFLIMAMLISFVPFLTLFMPQLIFG